MYHSIMATDMKRITVFVPEDVYEALVTVSERHRESLSNMGRRLYIEYLERSHPEILEEQRRKLNDK